MKWKELLLVVVVVALVMAWDSRHRDTNPSDPSHPRPIETIEIPSRPEPEAIDSQDRRDPRVELSVVGRPRKLDELVVKAKLVSSKPIKIPLFRGRPITYLYLRADNSGADLAHQTLCDGGIPNYLDYQEYAYETKELTHYEWDFKGTEMVSHHPEMVERLIVHETSLEVQVHNLSDMRIQPPYPNPYPAYVSGKVIMPAI